MYILGIRGTFFEDLSYFSIEKDVSLDLLELGLPDLCTQAEPKNRKILKICPVVSAAILVRFMVCDNCTPKIFVFPISTNFREIETEIFSKKMFLE